jgi:hypothetical protein
MVCSCPCFCVLQVIGASRDILMTMKAWRPVAAAAQGVSGLDLSDWAMCLWRIVPEHHTSDQGRRTELQHPRIYMRFKVMPLSTGLLVANLL